jgi:ribonuclease HI
MAPKSLGIGYAKEVFDAELIGILEALKIAVKVRKQRNYSQLTIFSDSQLAIQRILNDKLGLGQALAIEIIAITEELKEKDVLTTIRWVPSHFGIEGNEKADLLAKKAANQPNNAQIEGYSSFSYIQRLVQRQKALDTQQWLFNTQKQRL